jgi:hypothetical protein
LDNRKFAPFKNLENQLMQFSSLVFILKINQKSGIPFLPLLAFPASFNNVCLKKWFTALMG